MAIHDYKPLTEVIWKSPICIFKICYMTAKTHWNVPSFANCSLKKSTSAWEPQVCPWTGQHLFHHTSHFFDYPCMEWFLVNDQRDGQFFSTHLSLFLTVYMFRAHRAHRQERQIVSIQPLVAVTLCLWPCCVQVGSKLLTCTQHGHRHRVTATRGCIDTICLSWWWARCARNM